MNIRPYTTADQTACLSIFQGNTPHFFAVHEAAEFADFLNRLPCPYFVIERDGDMVACGGYFEHLPQRIVGLAWGMVRRDLHHQGIGTYLLLGRLHDVCTRFAVDDDNPVTVLMDTSQHSKGFFESIGFVVTHFTENGYTDGLHRYELTLTLDSTRRAEIAAALSPPNR